MTIRITTLPLSPFPSRFRAAARTAFALPFRAVPALAILAILATGCGAPGDGAALERESDLQATSVDREAGRAGRTRIAEDMWKTSTSVFRRISAAATGGGLTPSAERVASNSLVMISNMTMGASYGGSFIHPVAFYSTVKDFESSERLTWAGTYDDGSGLRWHGAFTSRNCTSGECYGLFQVDVRLENYGATPWRFEDICGTKGGLGLSGVRGGPDFCAAQYWWTLAAGGSKCGLLNVRGPNPCTTSGVRWTTSHVNRGRAAYVQQVQPGWNANAWGKMYSYYAEIIAERERREGSTGSQDELLRASARRWMAGVRATATDGKGFGFLPLGGLYAVTKPVNKVFVDAEGEEAFCSDLPEKTIVRVLFDDGGARVKVAVPEKSCIDFRGDAQSEGWIEKEILY